MRRILAEQRTKHVSCYLITKKRKKKNTNKVEMTYKKSTCESQLKNVQKTGLVLIDYYFSGMLCFHFICFFYFVQHSIGRYSLVTFGTADLKTIGSDMNTAKNIGSTILE